MVNRGQRYESTNTRQFISFYAARKTHVTYLGVHTPTCEVGVLQEPLYFLLNFDVGPLTRDTIVARDLSTTLCLDFPTETCNSVASLDTITTLRHLLRHQGKSVRSHI